MAICSGHTMEKQMFANKITIFCVAMSFAVTAHQTYSQAPVTMPEMMVYDLDAVEANERGGMVARTISAATIRVTHAEWAAGSRVPNHNHPDEHIIYVIEGRMRAFSGEQETVVEAGQFIVYPAYVPHRHEYLEDTVTIAVSGPGRTEGGPPPR
ncbi:MAG: cupin domain-containing protein [Proteobacteria bacterium]|nr:cupin domain-containing protein [Pseudomonadota bacterium]